MFISISVPVYNAEKKINRCIRSIISQTEQDFELILVNDGSTDNSKDVCESWVKRYPNKIRLINKENEGSLITRRRCLMESKADYIYIMDADDELIDINALRKIKTVLLSTGCDMVFFNCSTDKTPNKRFFKIPYSSMTAFEDEELIAVYTLLINSTVLNPLWNKVFSRNIVDWNSDYSRYMSLSNGTDMFQSIPIISKAKKIVYIDDIFYAYTMVDNEESIIHKFNPNIYNSMRANFLRLVQYAKKWQYSVPDLNGLLKKRFMDIASSAAFRARVLDIADTEKAIEYLRSIGEDELFLRYYTTRNIQIKRKIIIIMLKSRMYKLLFRIIRLFR